MKCFLIIFSLFVFFECNAQSSVTKSIEAETTKIDKKAYLLHLEDSSLVKLLKLTYEYFIDTTAGRVNKIVISRVDKDRSIETYYFHKGNLIKVIVDKTETIFSKVRTYKKYYFIKGKPISKKNVSILKYYMKRAENLLYKSKLYTGI